MKKNVLNKLMFIALAGLPFLVFSCMDSEVYDPYEQLNQDIATIDNYLSSNGITNVVKDPNGVRMIITELGTGLPAELGNTVDVNYVGKLFSTGAQFDAGNAKGTLSGYIDGWKIAFTTLPEGSKAKIYIPSYWGYGREAQGSIPANSILVFDVDFRDAIISSSQQQKFQSDTTAISTYIKNKAIDAIKDTTGIWYVINQQGGGPQPTWYSRVKMKYTFKLLTDDSKVVATVEREPSADFYSRVVDYIHGLKIGLQRMHRGDKATLYIPSGFGFGGTEQKDQSGSVIIPANSNLIIDIELIDVMAPL